jgi:Kdo2-lipid IVA lauroyltransferase/acyltransferase
MTLRHDLEYAALASLAACCRALPRGAALAVGAAVGEVGWLLRLRRALVLANVSQALPGLPPRERRRLAARAARNFGRSAVEILRVAGGDRRRLDRLVGFDGLDALRAAAAARGAIVVTPHLGPWGLYITALATAGVPAALLAGRQHNPRVDRFILDIPGTVVRMISKGPAAPREVLRCLNESRAVMMVADQDAGPHGEMVPFLGRTASTLPLPALIALRYGTPVFALAGHRVGRHRHLVRLSTLPPPPAGSDEERRRAYTAAINAAFAEAVLAWPDQYFWYHRRWRDYDPPARGSSAAQADSATAASSASSTPAANDHGR